VEADPAANHRLQVVQSSRLQTSPLTGARGADCPVRDWVLRSGNRAEQDRRVTHAQSH
jgi:hypothetical protein